MQEIHQATQAFFISSSPQQISPRPTVLNGTRIKGARTRVASLDRMRINRWVHSFRQQLRWQNVVISQCRAL